MICIENPPNKSHEINSYTTLLDIKPHLIKWNILQQVGRYYSIKYLQSKLSMVSVWQLHKFHFIISCSNFGGFYVLALCCPNQKKTEPNINPPLKSRSRRIPSSWLHPFPIAPGDRKKIPEKIACPVVVFREENPYHTIHVTDIFPYMNGWFCRVFMSGKYTFLVPWNAMGNATPTAWCFFLGIQAAEARVLMKAKPFSLKEHRGSFCLRKKGTFEGWIYKIYKSEVHLLAVFYLFQCENWCFSVARWNST